ncbi:MAG: YihA family ribosome biogenesis GTP-binding protein [Oscillospiraceae bacterium]|nr:YihA family ribosome biogenesis GTP-binding protein [Oscillospiraceae bacterium]
MNFNNVAFEASFGTSRQLPPSSLPEIVFAGKSNVGKSSLLNKLFNRKNLARVSSVPGKTTTVNFFKTDDVRFADLPGYGYAKRSKSEIERWSELMDGYFSGGRKILLVVQLLDMRHPPTADDKVMLNFLTETGFPFIAVLTKCDKLKPTERKRQSEYFANIPELKNAKTVIECSSETGEGMDKLRAFLQSEI